MDYEKLEKMDKTVDALRKRYGMDSVMRAAFLRQSIDHMCGGISREKRKQKFVMSFTINMERRPEPGELEGIFKVRDRVWKHPKVAFFSILSCAKGTLLGIMKLTRPPCRISEMVLTDIPSLVFILHID